MAKQRIQRITDVTPCVSCRLRRKKCNRGTPCERCQKLQIPAEWCIYIDTNAEKSSQELLGREKARNQQLKRYLRRIERVKSRLSEKGDGCLLLGVSNFEKTSNQVDYARGYLGPLSLASSVMIKGSPSTTVPLLKILAHERRKQVMEASASLGLARPVLQKFEESCMAAVVGKPVSGGDKLIKNLIEEIRHVLPHEDQYTEAFRIFKETNSTRNILGAPKYPAYLVDEAEHTIQFNKKGEPLINLKLPRDNTNIISLIFALMFLSMGTFITSKWTWSKKVSPSLFARYASSLLHLDLIGQQIKLEQSTSALLLTVALFQESLGMKYSALTNFEPKENRETSTLTTRAILARAKSQHFHESIPKWYPEVSEEDRVMYKDVWYKLVLLDTLDSFELGYLSDVTPDDFLDGGAPEIEIFESVRQIHEVLNDVSFLDGEIDAEQMIAVGEEQVGKVKKVYDDLESTCISDFNVLAGLNPRYYKENKNCIMEFYDAADRIFLRALMLGLIQTLYCLCWRCCEKLGETSTTSLRCKAYHVMVHKYAFASLEFMKISRRCVDVAGNDPDNKVGQTHVLWCLQLLAPFEAAAGTRGMLWIAASARESCDLGYEERKRFLLYHKDDWDMDMTIMKRLQMQDEFIGLPEYLELEDFNIDGDHQALVNRMGNIVEPKTVVFLAQRAFMKDREFRKIKYMNMGFMHLTKTFILGIRYSALGLRYFFPDEVSEYYAQKKVDQASTKSPSSDDFRGTFREMFEQVIDTRSKQQFDLGEFFGKTYDEDLQDSWIGDLVGDLGCSESESPDNVC